MGAGVLKKRAKANALWQRGFTGREADFLHYAAHDKAASSFGRNDDCFGFFGSWLGEETRWEGKRLQREIPARTHQRYRPNNRLHINSRNLTYPFPGSVLLFSCGFTVLRTIMNRFSVSNQNGAPNEIASAVITHPASSVTALKTASFGATRK
jgi:hypothetical protein